jgi:hypothetical protein
MTAAKQCFPVLHQLSDRVFSIANELLKLRRDESHGLCLIQLQTARKPLLREETCLLDVNTVIFESDKIKLDVKEVWLLPVEANASSRCYLG